MLGLRCFLELPGIFLEYVPLVVGWIYGCGTRGYKGLTVYCFFRCFFLWLQGAGATLVVVCGLLIAVTLLVAEPGARPMGSAAVAPGPQRAGSGVTVPGLSHSERFPRPGDRTCVSHTGMRVLTTRDASLLSLISSFLSLVFWTWFW